MGENSSTGSGSVEPEKWIKHYSNIHKILLVGEGDFSFALSLATASNIVATSLDSQDEVITRYSKAEENLKELKEKGCTIIHQVDVHTMRIHPLLLHTTFDRIVFNFPYAPLIWKDSNPLQILEHQKLVRGYMRNAREMLSAKGEVHVTHKTARPFSLWEIEDLAEEVGLRNFIGEESFDISDYPGYNNKRGYWYLWDFSFPVGLASTFKFSLY